MNHNEFTEVAITDSSGKEYFYWVKTDDEDIAIELASKKHSALDLPEPVEDFDKGVFPMAYQPVITENESIAVVVEQEQSS